MKLGRMLALALSTAFVGYSMPSCAQPASSTARHPGRQLAELHCIRCHLLPEPADLPREAWPLVLDWMGNYLGFRHADPRIRPHDLLQGLIPERPMMTAEQFAQIRDYYISASSLQAAMLLPPKNLPVQSQFEVVVPPLDIPPNGRIMLLSVDEKKRRLYVGSAATNELHSYDLQRNVIAGSARFAASPKILELDESGGFRLATFAARSSLGTNDPAGSRYPGQILDVHDFESDRPRILPRAENLFRLIDAHTIDLDGDGKEDIVTTQFGDGYDYIGGGGVSIFWNESPEGASTASPNMVFKPDQLLERAGMMSLVIDDFNNDGRPDIVAQSAQGYQRVILFTNLGQRRFREQILWQFRPSFGNMGMSAADIDGDGRTDLIISNGNNQELETSGDAPARPYHGIHVLRNDGDTFSESFFYPMYGATQAHAMDFDGDGDLDIAAISFYPSTKDRSRFPPTFVYLENRNGTFVPSGLPDSHWGRWMSMTTGDVNGDGRPDIVLGLGVWKELDIPPNKLDRYLGGRTEQASVLFLINRGNR